MDQDKKRLDTRKKTGYYPLAMILYIFWMILTMNFNLLNVLIGLCVSFVIARISNRILHKNDCLFYTLPNPIGVLKYSIYLIGQIYLSSFKHISYIIRKECKPTIVEVPLDIKDPLAIAIIANSITLTPGTITVDYKKNKLIVLAIMDDGVGGDRMVKDIKDKFETPFLRKA